MFIHANGRTINLADGFSFLLFRFFPCPPPGWLFLTSQPFIPPHLFYIYIYIFTCSTSQNMVDFVPNASYSSYHSRVNSFSTPAPAPASISSFSNTFNISIFQYYLLPSSTASLSPSFLSFPRSSPTWTEKGHPPTLISTPQRFCAEHLFGLLYLFQKKERKSLATSTIVIIVPEGPTSRFLFTHPTPHPPSLPLSTPSSAPYAS